MADASSGRPMIVAMPVRRTPISGMPKPPANAGAADIVAATIASALTCVTMRPLSTPRLTSASDRSALAESMYGCNYRRPEVMMSDEELLWRLRDRAPGSDYRIFKTAFVDAAHPRTGAIKKFSLIECVDWVNVIALTPADEVVLIRQYRAGTNAVCLEIPGGMVDAGEDALTAAARELEEE